MVISWGNINKLKKIAIFTEGQTELILIKNILIRIIDNSKLSLRCLELVKHKESENNFYQSCPEPEIYILIINVQGDEGVVSSIRDRETNLMGTEGYNTIIGVRDLYGRMYREMSPSVIDETVSRTIIEASEKVIMSMENAQNIEIVFAIMEIEAWILTMPNLFSKVHQTLTTEHIKNKLNIDLNVIDPQRDFYKPSATLKEILALCGLNYRKRRSDVESITSRIDTQDLRDAINSGKCERFGRFYEIIVELSEGCLYAK